MDDIFQAEYNENGKIKIMLENTAKMMSHRRIFKSLSFEQIYKSFTSNLDQNKTFYDDGEYKIAVILSLKKIKNIDKDDDINYFLNTLYPSFYNIIVVKKASPKVVMQIEAMKNVELVYDDDIMVSTIENVFVPEHILLSEEEQEQVKAEYYAGNKSFGLILKDKAIARYYNLKIGEIVEINRASITSGDSVYYRICSY